MSWRGKGLCRGTCDTGAKSAIENSGRQEKVVAEDSFAILVAERLL